MRTLKRIVGAIIVGATVGVVSASMAWAQDQDSVAETQGPQPGRDYFSQAPNELVDPLTGNLLLQFTDLVLPGNAGRDLRFMRTYSLKGPQPWSFGLAGMVMSVVDPWSIQQYYNLPTFWGGDGAQRGSILLNRPSTFNDPTGYQWVTTDEFWKYDRAAHRLYMPDGSVNEFDAVCDSSPTPVIRCLSGYQDPYGNRITLSGWGQQSLLVRQWLGNGENRCVMLVSPTTWLASTPMLPASIDTMDSTCTNIVSSWTYQITGPNNSWVSQVTSPVGSSWQYAIQYGTSWLFTVTTPSGGTTQYTINPSASIGNDTYCDDNGCTPIPLYTTVLTDKTLGGRDLPAGHWHWDYQLDQQPYPESRGLSHQTVATGPDGTTRSEVSTKTTYVYGCLPMLGCTDSSLYTPYATNWTAYVSRDALLTHRTVEAPVGNVLEDESRTYQGVTAPGSFYWASGTPGLAAFPELSNQTIIRYFGTGSRSYQTTYAYNIPNAYGDYHHPNQVAETGDLSRTITRTYEHHETPPNYLVGLPTTDTVSVGSETFTKAFSYDPSSPTTGFLTSQTIYGIQTTFDVDSCIDNQSGNPRPCGNVAKITQNSHVTSNSYSYGLLKNTTLPNGDTIAREIDQNSTNGRPVVTKVTQAGRATTFEFDDLFRVRYVHPPGGTAVIETQYDNTGGASVTVLRGPSTTQTNLDGFGRPRCTVNSLNIQACTEYDANGRKSRTSLPASGTPSAYTTFVYDGLGRFTSKTNPDATSVAYTYGSTSDGLTVSVQDENSHVTTQVLQGLGVDGDTRLARVTDAFSQTWSYSYNALGELTRVAAPGGLVRAWTYDASDRLSTDTEPESGTVNYVYNAGTTLLHTKTDANGTTFTYTYDPNDRLTQVSAGGQTTTYAFESGSDNRTQATVTQGSTTTQTSLSYETATGRLQARTDVINGSIAFSQTFGYNTLDQIVTLTYPSGRQVGYDYDNEGHVTRVCSKDGSGNCLAGKTYASAFTYHPSGAPLQYTGSNGLVHQFAFDARYRQQSITAGALGLGYSYDAVGNVTQVTDTRGDTWKQTFAYDSLNRLVTVTGNGIYPSSCFAYDARGNRTTACGTSYTYDGNDHLTNQSGVAFTYDAHGNLLTRSSPATTFTYTPDNMIATVSGGVSYQYDADSQRVLTSGPSAAYKYAARSSGGQLLSDWDGSTVNDYIYAGSRLVAIARITGGSWSGGGGSVPSTCSGVTFTDNPILPGTTAVKAVHAGELRTAIDATRSRYGLSGYAWSGALTAGTTIVQASQITEMRTALGAAYAAAGRSVIWYTDPTLAAGVTIKAAHFTELRGAVCALP